MGIFKRPEKTIDEYVAEAKAGGAVIIDVRLFDEFDRGHIPGAICIPLSVLDGFIAGVKSRDEDVYVYCASGMRSSKACKKLRAAGYAHVVNMGGIRSYHGPIER